MTDLMTDLMANPEPAPETNPVPEPEDAPRPRHWSVRASTWIAWGLLGFCVVFCAAWRLDGGRWVHVETPSMGEVAPVGSLLWVKPVSFESLEPGDFITFRPPGRGETTYSHRVFERNDDGTISTKGDIPAVDPWKLTSGDVIGEVRMNWWGVGWLVVAAPVLVIGILVVGLVRSLLGEKWRLPATLVLGSMVISLAIVIYKPLINAEQLAFAPLESGGAEATYVGTGLLPIRLSAATGDSVVMRVGEVGTVHVDEADSTGKLSVGLEPAIPFWWWIPIVVACFLPALFGLIFGAPPTPAGSSGSNGGDEDDDEDDHHGANS